MAYESQIVQLLNDIRGGDTVKDLDRALRELVGEIRSANKKGTLVLTIEIAPATKNNANTLVITDTITAKPPKVDTDPTIVFATDDNRLSRRDPRQPQLAYEQPEPVPSPLSQFQR